MRSVRVAGILLLVSFFTLLAKAQEADNARGVKAAVDSMRASAENRVKNSVNALGKKILLPDTSLLPQNMLNKGQLKQLAGEAGLFEQAALPKLSIFEKGKLIKPAPVQVAVDYMYVNDTTGLALGAFDNLRGVLNYTVNTGASVYDMPFNFTFRGMNGVYAMQGDQFDKLLKLNFDPKKYLEKIKNKVAEKLSPDIVLAATMKKINAVKSNYEATLKKEIESLKNDYTKQYKSVINLPEGITDLSKNDLAALKIQLAGVAENKLAGMTQLLPEGKLPGGDSMSLMGEANAKRAELLEKVYEKIAATKERFENNKLVKELKSHLPFTSASYKSFLAKPSNLGKVLDDHINLNFIQRLFVNITKFDIGQNPVQSGEFSMQNLINTGINTAFKSKKASFGFIYGKNNNVNNWMQAGLGSTVTNEYSTITGFTFGNGTGSVMEQSVSINLYSFNNSPGGDYREGMLRSAYLGVPPRRDATISFHTGYTINPKHKIAVDLSKSFGSFVDNVSPDSIPYKANAHSDVFGSAGKSNYAAMVDYTGELLNSDVRLFVKMVGMGYNNPGNALLRRGETQVGVGIARKLFKNKLTTRYNVDYRKQNFDPLKRYSHVAVNNKIQLGYRISRNNRVGLTYQRSDFTSRLFEAAASKGGNERLQVDGSYALKVAGKKIINNIAVSHQQLNVPMLADQSYKSRSVMLMYSSMMMMRKSPLSLLVLVNRSNNTDYLFNTSMFTAETNYSYAITDNIRFSSGVGYYTNAGWNRQLGGKQQVSASLMEKLNIDLEVSYKKAVHIIRPELADQLFVTAGAHFNF